MKQVEKTIKVDPPTYEKVRAMAEESGQTMSVVVSGLLSGAIEEVKEAVLEIVEATSSQAAPGAAPGAGPGAKGAVIPQAAPGAALALTEEDLTQAEEDGEGSAGTLLVLGLVGLVLFNRWRARQSGGENLGVM